jgi:hypothetical protein
MKKQLLAVLLIPLFTSAQEVKPVISNDYLTLIRHNINRLNSGKLTDSTNNMRNATLRSKPAYNFYNQIPVNKISINNNSVTLHPVKTKYLFISGAFTANIESDHANRLLVCQNEYVQGRSVNGALAWQGPETGELFSYGPAISSLEFDGSNYLYDVNGRLTTNGNGQKAIAYNNSVFRTGLLFSKDLTLYFKYPKSYQPNLKATLNAGQSREQTFISSNKNKSDHYSIMLSTSSNRVTISGSYNYRQRNSSNSNRIGFLNRVYRNSLLSPISFSARQGNMIGAVQRTYSPEADNPSFLLANKGYSFLQHYHTGILSAEYRYSKIKFKLSQSFEKLAEQTNEGNQRGTAFFPVGAAIKRNLNDNNYLLSANIVYTLPHVNYHFRSELTGNYIYTNSRSLIDYPDKHSYYHYQRSSNDIALSFSTEYSGNTLESGWVFTNKAYASNTSTANRFFLPGMSGYLRIPELFNIKWLTAKLFGSYNRFNTELPINRSLATYNLLQIPVADAMQYLPVTEVNSFDNLAPIKHHEYNSGVEISYHYKITFSASWFNRFTANDILPEMNGGQMNLVNMASHRNRGIELNLNLDPYLWGVKKLAFNNNISFISYRSKVTAVKNGYDYSPLAGFKDVHKAIVRGEALGVIVGNSWLKDANNNPIIGADGFPLVNNNLSVIGNPVLDFVLKMNHRISYKDKWDFSVDWEWKKGGDIWNGTQALLDYYGRSAATSALRNTTGYVFSGVQLNGSHNTIHVNFYDASLPVEQNRWVRYGQSGVAESYIQKGDCIRLHTIAFGYRPKIKKYLQQLALSVYANNIIIWSAYKGTDPAQLLNDQPGTSGLDFFNLPSARSVGFSVSLQF